MESSRLFLVPYSQNISTHFKTINEEWISDMFQLEEKDLRVLNNPDEEIIKPGGVILFARDTDLGIIGTCALMKTGNNEFELTKMGVLKKARGKKAGHFLLEQAILTAKTMKIENLYLLTNKKCEAAIHLYEQYGFQHDKKTMERFGSQYDRCDVAMRWFPTQGGV